MIAERRDGMRIIRGAELTVVQHQDFDGQFIVHRENDGWTCKLTGDSAPTLCLSSRTEAEQIAVSAMEFFIYE